MEPTEHQIDHLAEVITGYRYDLYEGRNSQCKSEYVGYLKQRWRPLAKRVLEPYSLDLMMADSDKALISELAAALEILNAKLREMREEYPYVYDCEESALADAVLGKAHKRLKGAE